MIPTKVAGGHYYHDRSVAIHSACPRRQTIAQAVSIRRPDPDRVINLIEHVENQSRNTVANPRKMKNPMESVINVNRTCAPKAGSCPMRTMMLGAQ